MLTRFFLSCCIQREEILANRARRKEKLEEMLAENQRKLEDHKAERNLLKAEEVETLEKRINAFSRKLETMQGDLDEREIEKLIEREHMRKKRHEERRAQRKSEL